MSLRSLSKLIRSRLNSPVTSTDGSGWQTRAFSKTAGNSSSSSSGGSAAGKKPEQLSDEELKAALPSMLFTTSNLIWSTTLAVGVATAGLLCMFQVGTWIVGAAQALKQSEQPAAAAVAPAAPKSLAELIAERKAELQQQLEELEQLPRTTEVKQALAAAKKELRQFRDPGQSWWKW